MAQQHDFIVVGSGGGGGTIAWLLGKAGYDVLLLEQGRNFAKEHRDPTKDFDPSVHDEFFFRLSKPDPKRKRRHAMRPNRMAFVVVMMPRPREHRAAPRREGGASAKSGDDGGGGGSGDPPPHRKSLQRSLRVPRVIQRGRQR